MYSDWMRWLNGYRVLDDPISQEEMDNAMKEMKKGDMIIIW